MSIPKNSQARDINITPANDETTKKVYSPCDPLKAGWREIRLVHDDELPPPTLVEGVFVAAIVMEVVAVSSAQLRGGRGSMALYRVVCAAMVPAEFTQWA